MKKKAYSLIGNCRQCGKQKYISCRGLCEKCGMINRHLVANQIQAKQGPYFSKWQAGMFRHALKLSSALKISEEQKRLLADQERQMMEQ